MQLTKTARRVAGVAAALTATALGMGLTAGSASAAPSSRSYEQAFVASINASRHAAGRAPLSTDAHLTAVARSWASKMAGSDRLAHNPHLTSQVGHWLVVGENVGVGSDERGLHSAFMHSPEHRANILSSSYKQVGVGVVFAHGRTWVVEDFRKPTKAAAHHHRATPANLHYGSRGAKVQRLQRLLGVRPTGFFGPVTKAHLEHFQRRHHLHVTGHLNRVTRHALHF